jgi:HK97 family phage prohead protease/HK97 family phage major capsid protein
MERTVYFSSDITAADSERRTIVGTVVPYGSVGHTSLGPVRFEAGSVRTSDTVKLVLEHDMKRPIGRATGFVDGPDRLVGSFRLSHTTAGSDALVEASDGLRDGLSVGARINEHHIDDNGVMVVSSADLVEVSLVHAPAFSDAVVSQVAASAPETDDTPTESQEDIVENETTEVAAAEVAASPTPTVEAARPSMPYITAAPRDAKNITAGGLLMHTLRAQLNGNKDSQDVVTHVQATVAQQDTTRDAGVIPIPLLREIVALVDANRPFIDSIDRQPLPPSGMSFRVPRVTTSVAVAEQGSQFDELQSTQGQIQDFTVDVKTFGGTNEISRQLIDRSDPSYFEELLRQLAQSYAHVTDKFAYDTVKSSEGASGSAGTTLYKATVKAIADSYGVMRFAPNTILLAPGGTSQSSWLDFLQAEDQDDRPLFSSANPVNAAGLISQGTTQGSIAGLRVVVDPHIGANEAARVYPGAFATFYESAGAPVRVEIQQPSTFSVQVSVGGYVAALAKFPTAIRVLNLPS